MNNQNKLPMITLEIEDNSIGWLHMTINNHYFCVSYLNDFIQDMRDLLIFNHNNYDNYDIEIHREYFDGEGVDLFLNVWKYDNTLFIAWEYYGDEEEYELMTFAYNDFIKEFDKQFMAISDKYWTQFDLDSVL